MVRLTRVEQQERTRAAVLAAAEAEFGAHGYAGAKIDRIAERAGLTRGAVYSNFPGKQALWLEVLTGAAERGGEGSPPPPPRSAAEALERFARVRLEGLPLADGSGVFGPTVRPEDDPAVRGAAAGIAGVEALLLALCLEALSPGGASREVRRAELVLRLLGEPGEGPARGDLFDVARACGHLASLGLADSFEPPHLPFVRPARSCRDPWDPPAELPDAVRGTTGFTGDGVVVFLGTERLGAAEEAVRAARPGDRVTVAVVTDDPAVLGRLLRLRLGGFGRALRRVFPPGGLPGPRVVVDTGGVLAAAAGVPAPGDGTEYAVRTGGGLVTARASGRGAGHAAASAPAAPSSVPEPAAARTAEVSR
jgi:AcrR family transcriptional regulator